VQRVARDGYLGHTDKLAELVHSLAVLRQNTCLDVDHLLCLAEIGRHQEEGGFHGCQTLADALCLPPQTVSRHIKFLIHAGYLANIQGRGRRLWLTLSQQGREAIEEAVHVLARGALAQ
jgi:DNA-binding MarR family transcriptional regulator